MKPSHKPTVYSVVIFLLEFLNFLFMLYIGIRLLIGNIANGDSVDMGASVLAAFALLVNGGFGIVLSGVYATVTLRPRRKKIITTMTYTLTVLSLLLPLWGISAIMYFLPLIVVLPLTIWGISSIKKFRQSKSTPSLESTQPSVQAPQPLSPVPQSTQALVQTSQSQSSPEFSVILAVLIAGLVPAILNGVLLSELVSEMMSRFSHHYIGSNLWWLFAIIIEVLLAVTTRFVLKRREGRLGAMFIVVGILAIFPIAYYIFSLLLN